MSLESDYSVEEEPLMSASTATSCGKACKRPLPVFLPFAAEDSDTDKVHDEVESVFEKDTNMGREKRKESLSR